MCALLFVSLLCCLTVLGTAPAQAAHHRSHAHHHYTYDPLVPGKDARLIVDGFSGKVLYSQNASDIRHPASLTKLMTLYLLFEALKQHRISMDTPLTFSRHAASQSAVNMNASAGMKMDVRTAINAVVVRSANDVAVLIAEALGGTEGHFATMMNAKARELGMTHTFYHNASGLPDNRQVTTAHDLALLARHISLDFPQYFPFFAHEQFSYYGHTYHGHDNLLGHYPGADGMKTGFVNMSGFNLVSSVTRGHTHLIGVVMGGRTAADRDKEMMRLMDVAFADIREQPSLVAHSAIPWHQSGVAMASAESESAPAPQAHGLWRVEGDGSVTPVERPGQHTAAASGRTVGDLIAASSSRTTAREDLPTPSARPTPAVLPRQRPSRSRVTKVAMNTPVPARRSVSEKVQPDVVSGTTEMHDWTIQIGAFNDLSQARTHLNSYLRKSRDVLGQAQKIIVPYQSEDGRWLYRARFGPFVERQARQICKTLTRRGETCFAATATR